MRILRAVIYDLLVVLAVVGAFTAGYLFHKQQNEVGFRVLKEAYLLLSENGLKSLPTPPAIEYGMVRGMMQAYDDPYTVFLEPPQNELEGNRLSGRYGGIGADVLQDAQGYWLLYPYPDGPATAAGVQDGDRLLSADQIEITPLTGSDAVNAALRGPVGKSVTLQIGRPPDYAAQNLKIEFAEYPLPSVTWRLAAEEPRLGIVKVNLIAASTSDEIQHAVDDLSLHGATHFALDLRDNPGGLLTSGVDVARLFLQDGVVMEQQYRGREVEQYKVEKPGPLADIPLVVLTNRGSASAAEIAAGALQAHQRALLIGEPTYGKDSIQLVFTLQDGSSMHVTAARWWIPGLGGQSIQGVGLQPDIHVQPGENQTADAFIQATINQFFGSSLKVP